MLSFMMKCKTVTVFLLSTALACFFTFPVSAADPPMARTFDSQKVIKDLNLFPQPKKDALYYFFSFSQPVESLEKVLPALKKAGAIMVLRGMKNNDFKETAKAIREFDGKYGVKVDINPPLFKKLGIDKVPAVTFVNGECNTCGEAPSPPYYTVYGDVAIDYALELIVKEDPAAEVYLERIRKNWFKGK